MTPYFFKVSFIAKGRRQKAFMFITGTWSFEPLKKVLTFMAAAISAKKLDNVVRRFTLIDWICFVG
jgi:hypothetical protein